MSQGELSLEGSKLATTVTTGKTVVSQNRELHIEEGTVVQDTAQLVEGIIIQDITPFVVGITTRGTARIAIPDSLLVALSSQQVTRIRQEPLVE